MENPEGKSLEGRLKEGENQKVELKNILNEMDSQSDTQIKEHIVQQPSFLKATPKTHEPRILRATATQTQMDSTIEQAISQENINPEVITAPTTLAAPPASTPSMPITGEMEQETTQTITAQPSSIPENFLETETPTGDFFKDLQIFLKQMGRAFAMRYALWEESDQIIAGILQKIYLNQQQNTEVMVEFIESLFLKLQKGFNDFAIKRAEVERYSGVRYTDVAKEFKKTLELLNFQVREFRLKQMVNELYDIYVT